MHALRIVEELVREANPTMHASRRRAVVSAVSSALSGATLSVTALGRGLSGPAYEKHRIKRMDRLLSNVHLQGERLALYTALARRVLGGCTRPVVSVDWSNLDTGRTRYLLRAAVAVSGRGYTLYEEVHPRECFMKASVERRFLSRVRQIVGGGCRPIIVTDAGFHPPWLRAVAALGWDYVCRVRGRVQLGVAGREDWVTARALYSQAERHPRALAPTCLSRATPLTCRFVLVRQARRYRHHLRGNGQRVRGHYSNEQARSRREPWLLATSLAVGAGALARVVRAYATRMQIEEGFRDLKSERFGLGYTAGRSKQLGRIEMLLLIALMALTVAWLIGLYACAAGLAYRYQANTLRRRAVLSAVYLGRRVWRARALSVPSHQWHQALQLLQRQAAAHTLGW